MDIKQIIEKLKATYKNGHKLIIHCCSMCNYACGYSWLDGLLHYDNGCSCTHSHNNWNLISEKNLENFFEMNPQVLEKYTNELKQQEASDGV